MTGMDETKPTTGLQCKRCNTDDPNRVIGFISGLCSPCEQSLDSVGAYDPLVQSVLASIDRVLAEPPSGDVRLVEVPNAPLTPEQQERADGFAKTMREQIEMVSPEVAEACAELEAMIGKAPPSPWTPAPGEIFEVQTERTGDRWLRMQMGEFSAVCLEANRPSLGHVTRMRPLGVSVDSVARLAGDFPVVFRGDMSESLAVRLAQRELAQLPDVQRERSETFSRAMRYWGWTRDEIERAMPVFKAPTSEQIPTVRAKLVDLSHEEQSPIIVKRCEAARAAAPWSPTDVIRGWSGLPDPEPAAPLPRPDGFSQSAIDAAKATLLATGVKRGGK